MKCAPRDPAVCSGLFFQSVGDVPSPSHKKGQSLFSGARGGQRLLRVGVEPEELLLVCAVELNLLCEMCRL